VTPFVRLPSTLEEALEADGEKLRQLTGRDHGPWFDPEPTDEELGWELTEVPINIYGETEEDEDTWR
jgi:hypothetical protein